jgi:hypothetical protein
MTWLTAIKRADIPKRNFEEHDQGDGLGLFAVIIASMVFWIVLLGWLAFSQLVRCDPCDWVVMNAPLEGWL